MNNILHKRKTIKQKLNLKKIKLYILEWIKK